MHYVTSYAPGMRGDIIFQVYGIHEGRAEDCYFGAFRTRDEALANIARLMHDPDWVQRYHNRGFVVRETAITTDFEIPSRPKPRDKYFVSWSARPNRPGTWDSTRVEVFRRNPAMGNDERICDYLRHYAMLRTFEPFRQGNRDFALISMDYTRTCVLDLASGLVIAEEVELGAPGSGFCPVGFFVPDWWDVHDGSEVPGSRYWSVDDEWPIGDFGFVWGCHWGDDSSWKVEYLDLSRVQDGIIRRDARFGYLELATTDFETPCLKRDHDPTINSSPPPFINVSRSDGISSVTFAVEMRFALESGKAKEWQRSRIEDHE